MAVTSLDERTISQVALNEILKNIYKCLDNLLKQLHTNKISPYPISNCWVVQINSVYLIHVQLIQFR